MIYSVFQICYFLIVVWMIYIVESQLLALRIQIRQICILLNSLSRVLPRLGSADEQSCWLVLLLENQRYKLDLLGSMCWLLQISITIRFPVVEPCRFPCNTQWSEIRQSGSTKQPQCCEDGCPLGFSCWPGGGAVLWGCVAASLIFLKQSILVSVV